MTVTLAGTMAATAAPGACQREVVSTRATLIRTALRLELSGTDRQDRCTALRHHASAVTKARQVFERCNETHALDRDVEGMDAALSGLKTLAAHCPG